MLRKRVIGVVTVKSGRAVQSFGFRHWLPLGSVECAVENLDRWGADEILLLVTDCSRKNMGPDLELVRRVSSLGLSTPLSYGGGIRCAKDGVEVVRAGADRVVVDAILHNEMEIVLGLADQLGAQAVIAALPLSLDSGSLCWLDHVKHKSRPLSRPLIDLLSKRVISELLVIDWLHEGKANTFDETLLEELPDALAELPRIAFGGIGVPNQCSALLQRSDVSAIALGNLLNYQEHALQKCKSQMSDSMVRTPEYLSTVGGS
jgi:cyclase